MTQFSPSYQQRFFSLKDDPIRMSEELASLLRKLTSADLCIVEVFEPISKSSVVFSCDSITPQFSTELPFKQFQIVGWSPGSCEAIWTGNSHHHHHRQLGVFMEQQLSLNFSRAPPQWRNLHEKLGMQSVLSWPLTCCPFPGQNQLLCWGSVTLAHRNPRFFPSTDVLYSNLTRLLKDFVSIAPVKLMRDLASLVHRLSHGLSLKNQTQILQHFLTSYTAAISASFSVFDNACQSAAFFIDPNNAKVKQKQQQEIKKEAFLLKENTAVWNTPFCGQNDGIPVNMESPFSFRHADLDLIHQNKIQDSKFLWILPIRGVPVERSEVRRVPIGAGPPVLGLSVEINGRGQSRWTGHLGAVYFHAKSESDFSESNKKSMLALIKILYPILEKTLKRGEIKTPEDQSRPPPLPALPTKASGATLSLPKDLMDQVKAMKEANRRKAQTQDGDLHKLKIDSLLDKNSANSVVLQGRYSNSNSAIKVMPGGQRKDQNFKEGLEHSILSSVNHPNIVRLLDSMLEVSGSRLLDTCCEDNDHKQVENWLNSKWPGLGSIRSSNWTLLVMEYCDGGSLEAMIHSRRKFDSSQVSFARRRDLLLTLLDISKAMEYLHDQGIVHGDLKPANILIKNCTSDPREWKCCIADFGSSLRRDCTSRTSMSRHGCTAAYRAPEIMYSHGLATRSHVHERCCADVYAFGMIIYEMIEGCRPFEGESGDSIARLVYEGRRPLMRSKHCPREVRQLLDECWAHEPKRRPTFGQISTKLEQLLDLEMGVQRTRTAY